MVVNKLLSLRYILFSLSFIFSTSCGAAVDVGSEDVLDHVSRRVLKATASYGERIAYCDKLVASSGVPKFDKKLLTKLNANRENVVTAVSFLAFNNYFVCERKERFELAYYLGTLKFLRKELKIDASSVSELQSVVTFPSIKELKLELEYLKLPQSQRNYFESIVGNSPFDLMRTLEGNGFIKE